MSETCPFCAIVQGETAADLVLETAAAIVIRDLNPQAPLHLLAVPRRHIRTLNDATPDDVAAIYAAALEAVRQEGHAETGYRTVINVHRLAGQSVWHLHLHILAGRPLRWPPG
jgi:histidine triad (HIT) family protein